MGFAWYCHVGNLLAAADAVYALSFRSNMCSQKDIDLCLLQRQHLTHLLCRQADPQHQTYSIKGKDGLKPLP